MKGELQLECNGTCGDDEHAISLAPRDPRSSDGVMDDSHGARLEQEYMKIEMVMKMALVKSRRKVMASSSRLHMQQKCEKLEGVEAWHRPDTCRHQRWQVCSGQFP